VGSNGKITDGQDGRSLYSVCESVRNIWNIAVFIASVGSSVLSVATGTGSVFDAGFCNEGVALDHVGPN
jgi:hypothetical protein